MKVYCHLVFFFVSLLTLSGCAWSSEHESTVVLSQDEQAWLNENPVVQVGYDPSYPPFEFINEAGDYDGIAADYLRLLEKKTGLSFSFVEELTWTKALEGAQAGRIDLLPVATDTPERRDYLRFTDEYLFYQQVFITRDDYPEINGFEDLFDKTLAVSRNYPEELEIKQRFPRINRLVVDNPLEELKAVALGEADASQGSLAVIGYLIQKYNLTNLKVAARSDAEGAGALGMGVRKGVPLLHSIIQKGLAAISEAERIDISRKWIPIELVAEPVESTIDFTPEEEAWITAHPVITLGTDAGWRPYVIPGKDGLVAGIEADFIRRINALTGLNIDIKLGKWSDIVEQAERKEIDGMMVSAYHKSREQHFRFTDSTYKTYKYIYTRSEQAEIVDMASLSGKRVAYQLGNLSEANILDKIPGIETVPLENKEAVLDKLLSGDVDAAISGVALRMLATERLLANIKLAFVVPESELPVLYSIRKDWPELQSILNKALAQISLGERLAILERWGAEGGQIAQQLFASLTDNELAWLEEHPRIRLGFNPDMEPWVIVRQDGSRTGALVEVYDQLEDALGIDFEIRIDKWPKVIDMARRQQIDVLMASSPNLADSLQMAQTLSFFNSFITVYARKDRNLSVKKLEDLRGLRIALLKGAKLTADVLAPIRDQATVIETDTAEKAFILTQRGDTDVTLAPNHDTYVLQKYLITDVAPIHSFLEQQVGSIAAVRSDWPELVSIINKAFLAIGIDNIRAVMSKWSDLPAGVKTLNLTYDEAGYLSRKGTLTYCFAPAWKPYDYLEDGDHRGMFSDYMKLFSEKLGVRLEPVIYETWAESYEQATRRSCDLYSGLVKRASREAFFSFTEPFFTVNNVLLANSDKPFISSIEEILDKPIGVTKGTAIAGILKERYPEIELIEYPTAGDRMRAILSGKAYATPLQLEEAVSYVQESGGQFKVVAKLDLNYPISVALRNDEPMLLTAFEKAVASVTPEEHNAIKRKWTTVTISEQVDTRVVWQIVGVALLILAFILVWAWSLSRAKASEQAARQLADQATLDLVKTNERLKELDQLKSMFIASMSHELRTPLNSIIGFTGILLQELIGKLNDKQRDSLHRVKRSGQHLLNLISDVIDISKIEAGSIDAYPDEFELDELVSEAIDELEPDIRKKGLIMRREGDTGLILHTDRRRLLQCVINYLSNAVKYTETGEVMLAVHDQGEQVEIAVKDTGIGISEEDSRRLFEAFERFDSHLRIKAGGTGLGLYLTKKITTDVLNGRVDAHSQLGEGSIFSVRIPKTLASGC